jgi:hypothetical protein
MSLQTQAPMSIKAMLRAEGVPLGGSVRADRARLLDDALFAMWESIVLEDADEEGPENAALVLFKICSLDSGFKVPRWLELVFKRHRVAIVDAVGRGQLAY